MEQNDKQKSVIQSVKENRITLVEAPPGERVIIVMGALNVILSRVSRTLTKYYSYIA
ncbi:hypothetical protein [Clostridium algidicarnis]|uniref:hypothetical protein n=1 Tax=Clostridium algidicarnis TaxID=37659 RepID=UPI001C0C721E|nr:hypothetical protein [Clostridium algidicarnis]MBU3194637.1 hypothetical protein [Clostridium algidicarnis]